MAAVVSKMWGMFLRSRLSDAVLSGPLPDRLAMAPAVIIGGSPERAREMLGEETDLSTLAAGGSRVPGMSTEAYHRFEWLLDLSALGDTPSRALSRAHIDHWINSFGQFDPLGWRADIAGTRVMAWLRNYRLIYEHAELIYRSRAMVSLVRQVRYLAMAAPRVPEGFARLEAALGLAYGAICLAEERRHLPSAMTIVMRELEGQIDEDGSHLSRNPAVLIRLLIDLVALSRDLATIGAPVPEDLPDTIHKMATHVRYMRHTDGGMPCFNGGSEMEGGLPDQALGEASGDKRLPKTLMAGGYARLHGGRTTVLADGAPAPPGAFADGAHAGALSFEMSIGRSRLIVNCGPTRDMGSSWRRALRLTAAHSTVTLNDESSATFIIPRGNHPRPSGPPGLEGETSPQTGGLSFLGRHAGYGKRFGLIHERRLFLDTEGTALVGEDRLLPSGRRSSRAPETQYTLRFHLHPTVSSTLLKSGAAMLKTADKQGWQLRTQSGLLALEESVYNGSAGRPRKTEQIVLIGLTEHGKARIRWTLEKV